MMNVQFQPLFEVSPDSVRVFALQAIAAEHGFSAADRCTVIAALREASLRTASIKIAVSVDAATIAGDPDFATFVEWSARAHGVDVDRVIIGIRRCALFANHLDLRNAIGQLRTAGADFAFEDVGSSYANVLTARDLRPSYIALGRMLIEHADDDGERRAAVRAIVDLAASIGASVIADAVATGPEFTAMREAGIRLMRGPLLAPARPPQFLERWSIAS